MTDKAYKAMKKFQTKFQDRGLEILLFPCGQFNNQEFDNEADTVAFLKEKYNIVDGDGFRVFKKDDVKGDSMQPAFKFFHDFDSSAIRWNFLGVFILNREGQVVRRASSLSSWNTIEGWLDEELKTKTEL